MMAQDQPEPDENSQLLAGNGNSNAAKNDQDKKECSCGDSCILF
jgi:hypothetical protein